MLVERKGRIAVTLHWRTDQDRADEGRAWADRVAAETGLALYPTRMAVELRPPVGVDKGDAVAALVGPARVGDVRGRRPRRPRRVRRARPTAARRASSTRAVRVAVRSPEEPAELVARTDVGVAGPAGFVSLLAALAAPDDRVGPPTRRGSRQSAVRAGRARLTRSSSQRSAGCASADGAESDRTRRALVGVHRERGVERRGGLAHVEGVDAHAVVAEQVVRAGLAREAEHGVALVEQRAFHRDEVEAVAHRVHEQHVGPLQRGDRAGEVVAGVDDDRLPVAVAPPVVDVAPRSASTAAR